MKFPFFFTLVACMFISTSSFALSLEGLLGCYKSSGNQVEINFHIEKDQMKLGDDPNTGKIVSYPGKVVMSARTSSGSGALYFLENTSENWKSIGNNTLQFYSSEIVLSPENGIFSRFVTFVINQDKNLSLSSIELFSTNGPGAQESRYAYELKRVSCPW